MGRGKKRQSILQRERAQQREERPAKKPKRDANSVEQQQKPQGTRAAGGGTASQRQRHTGGRREPPGLRPTSAVHSQAAYAVRRLLEADASKAGGVTLKGLTLAPHVEAKKVGGGRRAPGLDSHAGADRSLPVPPRRPPMP
jgi:hypothetical protein